VKTATAGDRLRLYEGIHGRTPTNRYNSNAILLCHKKNLLTKGEIPKIICSGLRAMPDNPFNPTARCPCSIISKFHSRNATHLPNIFSAIKVPNSTVIAKMIDG
jgi:hypothetical protein